MVDTALQLGVFNDLIDQDIQYKITKAGKGPIAEVNQLVRCDYIGRLEATGNIFERANDAGYRIGDQDTTPGLELGLRHMRRGEQGVIRCSSKYGYGPVGRSKVAPGANVAVPPNASLQYEVIVTDILPAFLPKDMAIIERLAEAKLKKIHGNDFFYHEDYNRAIRCYQAAIKALDADSSDEETEAEQYPDVVKTFCDISNNLAAALMKLERYKDVKEVCVKVIEVDKDNVKALYRGGLAALRQHNYEEAELALKEAIKLNPKDSLVRETYQKLKDTRSRYVENEKRMYHKMSGFLTRLAATGIDEDVEGADKEVCQSEKMQEPEQQSRSAGKDVQEGDEEQEGEGQYEGIIKSDRIPGKIGMVQKVKEEIVRREGDRPSRKDRPWLRWYIRNYQTIMTVTMAVLPAVYFWQEVWEGWRERLGFGRSKIELAESCPPLQRGHTGMFV